MLLFSLIGMAGSYGVAWYGIRINTLANSRTAFASAGRQGVPGLRDPAARGHERGHDADLGRAVFMLAILLFIPGEYAGACFLGFAIGESLGASALRIAGGIFTKIADIGSDLMKIVFKIKEDDARNPGVIADCVGDNAGDSVGPTADGFETYGVTGVALISFIMLAVPDPLVQVQLLVWIFSMRVMMVVASGLVLPGQRGCHQGPLRQRREDELRGAPDPARVADLHPLRGAHLRGVEADDPDLGGDPTLWWKLSTVITCGTLAGAVIPELVKVFTSTNSAHVKEVVTRLARGRASLNILSGLVAGNFSAYWLGLAIMGLMAAAYLVSHPWAWRSIMQAPAVFAFGLVAFGFLGMGPVTIAVDSYGPVTDNAQSVYELSTIEQMPGVDGRDQAELRLRAELRDGQGAAGGERRRRQHVQGHGQAGADRHRRRRAPPR